MRTLLMLGKEFLKSTYVAHLLLFFLKSGTKYSWIFYKEYI